MVSIQNFFWEKIMYKKLNFEQFCYLIKSVLLRVNEKGTDVNKGCNLLTVLLSILYNKLPWLKAWLTKSGKKLSQKKPLRLICESTVKNKIAYSSVAKIIWAKSQIFQKDRWNLPRNLLFWILICQVIQENIFTIISHNNNMGIFMGILAIFIMEIITIMAIELLCTYSQFRIYFRLLISKWREVYSF